MQTGSNGPNGRPRKNSPHRASVAPFFILNGGSDTARLAEMMDQCAEAGFDGVFLHAREGLRTPYMSEAWLDAIEFCVRAARERGMTSWLYDEFPYPSGVAGGRVIRRHPEFAEKHLQIRRFPVEGGGRTVVHLGAGDLVEAFLVPCDPAPRWDEAITVTRQVGVCNSTWIVSDWDSRFYYDPEHSRLYRCRRSLEAFPEQVFEGEVGPGRWELLAFFQASGGEFAEPFGHYVDVSCRAATDAFIEETHARYRERLGALFGGQIPGIFTDEPKYRNGLPWSLTIAREWSEYRADPRALLALAREEGGERLRRAYRHTASRLFTDNWVRPIRDWCADNRLQLVGHISPEEDWWLEARFAGSILQHLRQFSIPGCDLIIPAVGDARHPVLNLTPTLAVSAAAQSGANRALCEVFGCSDYSLDPQTLKRVGDWLAVSGIDFFVPHGCFYSLAGPRRFDAPPTFLPPMTLHRFLPAWTAQLRDTASRLGPRAVTAEIALVRPFSVIYGMADHEQPAARALFLAALDTARCLLDRGIPFHWIDDLDLAEATVAGGHLKVGHAAYRQLVVFREPADENLRRALRSIRNRGIGILSPSDAALLEGPLACEEGDVRAARDPDTGEFFCVNLAAEPRDLLLEGRPHRLEAYESRWLSTLPSKPRPLRLATARVELGPDWHFERPRNNLFRLTRWNWGGLERPPGPVLEILPAGTVPQVRVSLGLAPTHPELPEPVAVSYQTAFEWRGPIEDADLALLLDLEAARGAWTAALNGSPLDAWQPVSDHLFEQRHPLNALLREGRNLIAFEFLARDAREGLLLPPCLAGNFEVLDTVSVTLAIPQQPRSGSDWTKLGYPHFSGTAAFSTSFEWTGETAGAEIVFDPPPTGPVEVELNGVRAGLLLWSPWQLPLGELLVPGTNTLRLHVTNTLQNAIYGFDLPSGPLDGVAIQSTAPAREIRTLKKPAIA